MRVDEDSQPTGERGAAQRRAVTEWYQGYRRSITSITIEAYSANSPNYCSSVAASPVSHRSDSCTAQCCRQLGLHCEIELQHTGATRVTITNIFPSLKLLPTKSLAQTAHHVFFFWGRAPV